METLPGAKYATAAAFSEVVALYGQDMHNVALYYLDGNTSDADDACQNALLAAFQRISSLRDETALKSWLLKIVRNACLGVRRGRKNNRSLHVRIDTVAQLEGEPALVSPDIAADDMAIVNEGVELMQKTLNTISPDDRKLLIKHHAYEEELSEIARSVGLTTAGVKTRLFRARREVQKRMSLPLARLREAPGAKTPIMTETTLPAPPSGPSIDKNFSAQLAEAFCPQRRRYRRKLKVKKMPPTYFDKLLHQYCRQFLPLIVFQQQGRQCVRKSVDKVLREFIA